ncbi:unnamed protein product [Tilletia controversa]|nr:unnamed protein product [Tilletia controversa]
MDENIFLRQLSKIGFGDALMGAYNATKKDSDFFSVKDLQDIFRIHTDCPQVVLGAAAAGTANCLSLVELAVVPEAGDTTSGPSPRSSSWTSERLLPLAPGIAQDTHRRCIISSIAT